MTMREKLKYCENPAYAPDYFRTVAGIDKLNFQVKILYGDYIKFYNKNLVNLLYLYIYYPFSLI